MPDEVPGRTSCHTSRADEVLDAFRHALEARHIVAPDSLIADGSIHRCDAAGKKGRGDAAYILHLDDTPAGGFINWRDGREWESWCFGSMANLSRDERQALRQRFEAAARERAAASAERHRQAADRAGRIWSSARPADERHGYVMTKGVSSHNLRVYKGALVVPVVDPAARSAVCSSSAHPGASGSSRAGGSRVGRSSSAA